VRSLTYPMPPGATIGGMPVESITVRETNGLDEGLAEKWAEAKKPQGSTQIALLPISTCKVNGTPPPAGFADFDSWPTKHRNLVLAAFNRLNGTKKEDLEAFLASAVEEDAGASSVDISSVSG
jgi:hypothetical protein